MSRSAAALVVALLLTGPAEARDGKKIFVSVDMEGIAGVVTGEQLGPQGFEYASFRELMTQEANAAKSADATTAVEDKNTRHREIWLQRLERGGWSVP